MIIRLAPVGRTEGSRIRLTALAAVLCALLLPMRGAAQVPEAAAFAQRAEVLRNALTGWQNSLSTMTLGQAPLLRPSLGNRQSQCLEWVPTLRIVIARVNKKPTLGNQLSLLSSLTFFDNTLLNLGDALELARTMNPSASEVAILNGEQERVAAIRRELGGFYTELSSKMFSKLRAVEKVAQPAQGPGEISGYVYRLDSGKPLARAIVTLESPNASSGDILRQTGDDGSYRFAGLVPGNYWVIAYRSGFVGSVFGIGTLQNASKGLISLAPGQERSDIDFRLSPAPEIATLSGGAIEKAHPGEEAQLAYGPGAFSPDGKQFVFAVAGPAPQQICFDSVASGEVSCVAGPSNQESLPGNVIKYFAWQGATLYAETGYLGGVTEFFTVTSEGTKPVLRKTPFGVQPFFPPALVHTFSLEQNHESGAEALHLTGMNSQFLVNADNYGGEPGFQLVAQTRDGENPYQIAVGGRELWSFVFDADHSVVFYPVSGRYRGALVSFDLRARRYQKTALPFSQGLKLLDAKIEGNTTLVAYTVDGPCVPAAPANGEDPWHLPNRPLPAAQPSSLCLATIPAGKGEQ